MQGSTFFHHQSLATTFYCHVMVANLHCSIFLEVPSMDDEASLPNYRLLDLCEQGWSNSCMTKNFANLDFHTLSISIPMECWHVCLQACAEVIKLNMSLLLFSVCKCTMTYLRSTALGYVIPFDDRFEFHKVRNL